MMTTTSDPTGQESLASPLPQRYGSEEEGIGGQIKARPEDFNVEELPLYEPSGAGEHLYLGIEKTSVSHIEMISCLRRHFDVREQAIGFAGMKDKFAVTRQTVSIHLHEDPPRLELEHRRIRLLWASRHTNKIRIGHLYGNRFSIRIRGVDPAKVTVVKQHLERLQAIGFPNYFGSQRFGYRGNNHLLGAALLRGDHGGLLAELLGTTGSPFPEYQLARRELFDQGRFEEAAAMWTPADRNELTVINALRDGKLPRVAARTVGKTALGFWISALQSAVFNRVLDARIDDGTLVALREGDLAWKHNNGSVFLVSAEDLDDGGLANRIAAFELSPSGPLWGEGMIRPGPEVAEAEVRALDSMGLSEEEFVRRRAAQGEQHSGLQDPVSSSGRSRRGPQGARRPLRAPFREVETEAGVDEHGDFVRLAFDLPRGTYATVLLREIMKAGEVIKK